MDLNRALENFSLGNFRSNQSDLTTWSNNYIGKRRSTTTRLLSTWKVWVYHYFNGQKCVHRSAAISPKDKSEDALIFLRLRLAFPFPYNDSHHRKTYM